MRKITKRQFDAFCYSRAPVIRIIAGEVAWFEAFDRKLLATIVFDKTDRDFGFVVLGRDACRMYRAIDLATNFKRPDEAEEALRICVDKYRDDGKEVYVQGDEKEAPKEILVPCVEENKLHPYFKVLVSEPRLEAARNLINEIVYTFVDTDGHYIREFQTGGFDARLWELYLYVYLHNAGFSIISDCSAPDYHVSFFGEEFFIEAVTVNASQNPGRPDADNPESHEDILDLTNDYLPIKFGSSLFSKLRKRYWEKEHVRDKPLIIAIHDYHMPGSMTWSRCGLSEYLYGVRVRLGRDRKGQAVPVFERVKEHSWRGKTIPSDFFSQPDAEHISAVMFSNAATPSKFNRMGKLAGLGSKDVKLIRKGLLFDPDPKSLHPIPFSADVDSPDYEESWSDSIVMFHNPNARIRVNPSCFGDISHTWFDVEKQEFLGYHQPYDVLHSITFTISATGHKPIEDQ
jgi:hypothetical protein